MIEFKISIKYRMPNLDMSISFIAVSSHIDRHQAFLEKQNACKAHERARSTLSIRLLYMQEEYLEIFLFYNFNNMEFERQK